MSNSIEGIVQGYKDIDRVHSIEKDRERTMGDINFQNWCKRYKIGSRVQSSSVGATDIMTQYTKYPQWVARS
jgi:hypothetical protein